MGKKLKVPEASELLENLGCAPQMQNILELPSSAERM